MVETEVRIEGGRVVFAMHVNCVLPEGCMTRSHCRLEFKVEDFALEGQLAALL
jgi:hypothetical protein